MNAVLLFTAVEAYALWFLGPARRTFLGSAQNLFLIIQAPFLLTVLADFSGSSHAQLSYAIFCVVGLATFMIGALLAQDMFKVRRPEPTPSWGRLPAQGGELRLVVFGAAVCCAVGVYFLHRVGYNTFLVTLLGESSQSFRNLRAEATRSHYVAAGYAVQFFGILLPAIGMGLILVGRAAKRRMPKLIALLLLIASVAFSTATGGRVYVLQMLVLYALISIPPLAVAPALAPWRKIRRVVAGAVLFLIVFTVLSSLQGRLNVPANQVPTASIALLGNRVGGDYAYNELRAVDYLAADGTVYGKQWIQELQIALPGPTTAQTLDSRLHQYLYGSADANSPLSFWGSIFYNWGFAVGIIWTGVFGFFVAMLSLTAVKLARSPILAAVAQALMLRLVFVRDPYSFLLEGCVTLIGFGMAVRIVSRIRSERPSDAGKAGPSARSSSVPVRAT